MLLLSLFLPWFSWSDSVISLWLSGMAAHGFLWLVFLLCLGILGFLAVSALFGRFPVRLPVSREWLLLAATGSNLLLVLIAFLVNPVPLAVGVGRSLGAFTALIAAAVACAPRALRVIRGAVHG